MEIGLVEFSAFEMEFQAKQESPLNILAPEIGRVYVVAITRDGCPACLTQKPQLDKLAKTVSTKHGDKVVFSRMHIKYGEGSTEESLRSKDVFGHYFYPTILVLLKTRDRGAIEYYRNASPDMDELRKNIKIALDIAESIEKS